MRIKTKPRVRNHEQDEFFLNSNWYLQPSLQSGSPISSVRSCGLHSKIYDRLGIAVPRVSSLIPISLPPFLVSFISLSTLQPD